jgi:RNA polymerase sigma-70 factor (ECF subfamily)
VRPVSEGTEAALAATFRDEWPRLVAAAMWIVGDLQTAEDVAQETLITALDSWPLLGIPGQPGAWLMTACRNRARNVVRDAGRAEQRYRAMRPLLAGPQPGDDVPPQIRDDRLRLIAMCCHPLLPAGSQVALTLRLVAGLTTDEIARGFHLPAATVAQRIVRAKRTLTAHRVTFAADEPGVAGRLPSIVDVVYLIFNEGYLPAAGGTLTRGDLALEAHRLAGLLTELAAGEPEPWALRALLSFHLSRWATRTGADGALLTLDVQDRSRWDRELIADGEAALRRAGEFGVRGPLLLQAELAAAHATAPAFAVTDWPAIVARYDELIVFQDTAVVALNRAVAIAMAAGPAAALPLLDELVGDPALRGSHRVWAVRADLHRRLGDRAAALADYDYAISLASNDVERRYLAEARKQLNAGPPAGASQATPSPRRNQRRKAD